jgi:hypothetical protein
VLVALDADEILSANALTSPEWRAAVAAAPGTSGRIARIELCERTSSYFRHAFDDAGTRWGFVYADDGSDHDRSLIHGDRLPESSQQIALTDVVVLHYSHANHRREASKDRWYQCFEHVHFGDVRNDVDIRRRYDWAERLAPKMAIRPCPAEWTAGYEAAGIDLAEPPSRDHYWTDWDVLHMFAEHGTEAFALLDIWDVDWEEVRLAAVARGVNGVPMSPIRTPNTFIARLVRWFLKRSRRWRWRGKTDAVVARALRLFPV